jgi:ACS family hexuronate transporter-like MFS transporter
LWIFAAAKFLSDMTWWLTVYWLPDYFHRTFAVSGWTLGVPLAAVYGAGAVGSLAAGVISSRLAITGHRATTIRPRILITAATLALALPLVAGLHEIREATLLLGLILCAHQLFSVTLFSMMADGSSEQEVGRIVSFAAFSGNIGGMLVVAAAGKVLASGLGYLPLFLGCGVTYALAATVLLSLLPEYRRSHPAASLHVDRRG